MVGGRGSEMVREGRDSEMGGGGGGRGSEMVGEEMGGTVRWWGRRGEGQ